jgi:hypothetical protein
MYPTPMMRTGSRGTQACTQVYSESDFRSHLRFLCGISICGTGVLARQTQFECTVTTTTLASGCIRISSGRCVDWTTCMTRSARTGPIRAAYSPGDVREVVQAMHVPLPRRARGIRGVHRLWRAHAASTVVLMTTSSTRSRYKLSVGVRLEQQCGAVVANARALECRNAYTEERERVGASEKNAKKRPKAEDMYVVTQ